MTKKGLWLVLSGLMVLSLVLAACGPAAAPTTPTTPTTPTIPTTPTTPAAPSTSVEEKTQKEAVAPQVPKYGGTLTLVINTDPTQWDIHLLATPGVALDQVYQLIWDGDWTLGIAGGYGTAKTDWRGYFGIFYLFTGYVAERYQWSVDTEKDKGTLIYQIRRGIHYALNPKSEASRLTAGRELTADDVIFNFKRSLTSPESVNYRVAPKLRVAEITKTGPWEVTAKLPLDSLIEAINRLGSKVPFAPPEVVAKYGNLNDWRNSVGTGPFILTDYVPGSQAVLVRNPNYWLKDPVGPGKGNQLPYLDGVRVLVIPDASTRMAALRTGKIDQMYGLTQEEATQLKKTTPALLDAERALAQGPVTFMNNQRAPFTDIRVRKALLAATDLKAVNQGLFAGRGQTLSWPFAYAESYADLYLGLDDPALPAATRELYTYNPERASQLLKEAGYPNGFKTSLLLPSTEVDYYSIIKDQWAKVGIDLELKIREPAAKTALANAGDYDLNAGSSHSLGQFYMGAGFATEDKARGMIKQDPVLTKGFESIRRATITDMRQAMREMKELAKYILDQVYVVPQVVAPDRTFWWPWLRNYSGEEYLGVTKNWPQFLWYDGALKKSMGY